MFATTNEQTVNTTIPYVPLQPDKKESSSLPLLLGGTVVVVVSLVAIVTILRRRRLPKQHVNQSQTQSSGLQQPPSDQPF